MIKSITLRNFKKWNDKTITLNEKGLSLIVGGNNSGKSTILHALAVWEYCKTVLIFEKGDEAIRTGFRGAGFGVNIDDFTPLNIPSLKYLWTNLNPGSGYNLSIRCTWDIEGKPNCFLEIGLALAQERLFIKTTATNLIPQDRIPTIAYLPPFAGISDKESWVSVADRRRLIGRGLAGAVLRNTIIDLFNENQRKRDLHKDIRGRIPRPILAEIRNTDPYEKLNQVIFSTFMGQISPQRFNPNFHNYVKVDFEKGEFIRNRFKRFPNYNQRDIMVEGSGFLQWLSVYTFALNPEINLLLLDEPDAHLHCSLQSGLVEDLREIANAFDKQVLIATHSSEVVKNAEPVSIMHVNGRNTSYLRFEDQKTLVLSGLGTEYSPIINKIQKGKRILFTENASDVNFLKIWAAKLNIVWPENLTEWPHASKHIERKNLFIHLIDSIPEVKAISLSDRDSYPYENTNRTLTIIGFADFIQGNNELRFRMWRRWEIESYLICPNAIARVAGVTIEEVHSYCQINHGIVFNVDYLQSDMSAPIRPLFDDSKPIIENICQQFSISKYDIANAMTEVEIFEDVRTLLSEIVGICAN